ncbi:hypothetical protein GCM10027052_26870 [Parafrigoribacterium mesophilum]|uniref:MFS transporter n=1 Tax=Parafrigoribacterium mesophilum TaxID=433646 RepID=UPI0031FC6F5E
MSRTGWRRGVIAPLYAAGFTTAFGAHSIAAGFGAEAGSIGLTLLSLGILLAVYDVAEVVLKPVFGSLSDRIGTNPVIIGGLIAFAVISTVGMFVAGPVALGLVRLGQGAAAAAFSPASSATVARLSTGLSVGEYFGRFGSWKALGYALGPILGAGLIWLGGFPLLFGVLAGIATVTAVWVGLALPALPPLPRPRYTLVDLTRQVTQRSFLIPTLALAAATGSLGAAVGFLPAVGSTLGMDIFASTAVITVLALASSLVQPFVGHSRDRGRVGDRGGIGAGLVVLATGIATVAVLPAPITLYLAAAVIGVDIGTVTPLGFAHLAETTPPERMGRTMGSAELGRELGDAGGPLLVGSIVTVAGASAGLGVLALAVLATGGVSCRLLRGASPVRSVMNPPHAG